MRILAKVCLLAGLTTSFGISAVSAETVDDRCAIDATESLAVCGDLTIEGDLITKITPKQLATLVEQVRAGLSEDNAEIATLAKEIGTTQGAVTTFLVILGETPVDRSQLPQKLVEIAIRHVELTKRLRGLNSSDEEVAERRLQAADRIDRADYDEADALLSEAEDLGLAAIAEQEAALDQRKLSAAETRAERGELALIRLDYATAAGHFAEAVSIVPVSFALERAQYPNSWGKAAGNAGNYKAAHKAYQEALAVRESELAADDPLVAVSLNNLGFLYNRLGLYEDAEPLYERALAIFDAALGEDHRNTQTVRDNLAQLKAEWEEGHQQVEPAAN